MYYSLKNKSTGGGFKKNPPPVNALKDKILKDVNFQGK